MFTTLGTASTTPRAAEAHQPHDQRGQAGAEDPRAEDDGGLVPVRPAGPMSLFMRGYSRCGAPTTTRRRSTSSSRTSPARPRRCGSPAPALTDLFSVGPILQGMGLNVTVWSYLDRMNFSLLSLPRRAARPGATRGDHLSGSLQDRDTSGLRRGRLGRVQGVEEALEEARPHMVVTTPVVWRARDAPGP